MEIKILNKQDTSLRSISREVDVSVNTESHLHFADVGIKCYTFNKSSDDFIMNIQ